MADWRGDSLGKPKLAWRESFKLRHLWTLLDLAPAEINEILDCAGKIKEEPAKFNETLKGKTMLMLFSKPSLRTRVSFETGMLELGGHAIFYSIADSPLGKKETIEDTAKCLTEYVDIIMARLPNRETFQALKKSSGIPCLNGLDDWGHPCQIMSDIFTMRELKGDLKGKKIVYYGDCHNNVTYDIMRAAALMGMNMLVAGPKGEEFEAETAVYEECAQVCKTTGGSVQPSHDAKAAAKDADIVYTDSWMSYHIKAEDAKRREAQFMPFQVTKDIMAQCKPDAVFMNCLPAMRGMEQTAEVIDGPQSVVFRQAGNRLHVQKAITLFFLNSIPK